MVNWLTREMLPKLFKGCYELSLGRDMLLYYGAGFGFLMKNLVLGCLETPNTLLSQYNKLSYPKVPGRRYNSKADNRIIKGISSQTVLLLC